jgi:hypothetical protein
MFAGRIQEYLRSVAAREREAVRAGAWFYTSIQRILTGTSTTRSRHPGQQMVMAWS